MKHVRDRQLNALVLAVVLILSGLMAGNPGVARAEWYDPSDWFESDAGIEYENDWYDYSYGYDDDGYYDRTRGYYDNQYNADDNGGFAPGLGGDEWEYDYYSDNWYDDDGLF